MTVLKAATESASDGPLVILGDLFDTPRPNAQLVSEVIKIFCEARRGETFRHGNYSTYPSVILLMGNHDQASTQKGDNALAAFDYIRTPTYVVDRPMKMGKLLLIPFQRGEVKNWFLTALAELDPSPGDILCMHAGIISTGTPWYLRNSTEAVGLDLLKDLVDEYSLGGVYSGDWHNHAIWRGTDNQPISQVGALVPTGFDNLGTNYGNMVSVDVDDVTKVTVQRFSGPRYLKWDSAEGAEGYAKLKTSINKCPGCLVRVKETVHTLMAEDNTYSEDVMSEHDSVDFYAIEKKHSFEEAASAASESVRSGADVNSIIDAYVADLPIEASKQQKINEMIRGYLNRGAPKCT